MNGVTSEEGNSELSLMVDLQHFGEVCTCIFNKLMSIFHASVLLVTMNFIVTLSK